MSKRIVVEQPDGLFAVYDLDAHAFPEGMGDKPSGEPPEGESAAENWVKAMADMAEHHGEPAVMEIMYQQLRRMGAKVLGVDLADVEFRSPPEDAWSRSFMEVAVYGEDATATVATATAAPYEALIERVSIIGPDRVMWCLNLALAPPERPGKRQRLYVGELVRVAPPPGDSARFVMVRFPAGLYGVYDKATHTFPEGMASLRARVAMGLSDTPMARRGAIDFSNLVGNWWRVVADIEFRRGKDAAMELMQEHLMRSLAAHIGVLDMDLVDVIPDDLEHEFHVATCIDADMTLHTCDTRVESGEIYDPIGNRTWEMRGALAPPRIGGEQPRLFVAPIRCIPKGPRPEPKAVEPDPDAAEPEPEERKTDPALATDLIGELEEGFKMNPDPNKPLHVPTTPNFKVVDDEH